MNFYFSKEELQIILLDMDININKTRVLKVADTYRQLRDKTQFMIDNYCEVEMPSGIK